MKNHSQADYYHYLSAYIRWQNAKNMKLMGVTEEEVKRFVENKDKQKKAGEEAPNQNSFYTLQINPDNLPDFKDWIK